MLAQVTIYCQNQAITAPKTTPVPAQAASPLLPATPSSQQNTKAESGTSQTAQATPRPTHHIVTLALPNGSKIEVESPKPLPQGAQILLQKGESSSVQVLQLQTPSLEQKSALDKPAIQEVLRNALPNQIPTGDAFSQLSQLTRTTHSEPPAQLNSVIRSMLQLSVYSLEAMNHLTRLKETLNWEA